MIVASPLEILRYIYFAKPNRTMLEREFCTTPFIVNDLLDRLRNAELIECHVTTERWILTAKGKRKLHASETPVNEI